MDWIATKSLSPDAKRQLWRHIDAVAPALASLVREVRTQLGVDEFYLDIRRSDPGLHAALLAASDQPETPES
jgi:hypothetical protein